MKRYSSAVVGLVLVVMIIILAFFPNTASAAGTNLFPGDIVFVGLNSDGDDEFAMLLLRDIAAGTSFYITDKGWDGAYFVDNSGDGIWRWTASSAMSAGDIIHIKTTNNGVIEEGSLAATPGSINWVENNGTVISYSGDQVFLYQGPHDDPTFIAGIHYNLEAGTTTANWDGFADSNKTSALPGQLTNGINAIWVYLQGATPTEQDNFRYDGSVKIGSLDELRAAICNLNNWDVDPTNTTAYTLNPYPYTFTVEGDTPPSVSITSTESDATNSSPFTVDFTFDEDVTGFAVGDITVTNGSASNFTANSASSYSADITPTADGTVTVDVAANVCSDTTGNSNTAAAQFSIDYDTAAPTVSITSAEGDPTNSSPFTVAFTFSEDVTGFAVGDITVSNGAASNFTTNSTSSYSADITPAADGTVTVNVAANVCTDIAGNSNTAASQFSIDFDTAAPTVSITSAEGDPTNSSPFTVTFTYSEDVTGFAVGDIAVVNGTASNFATNSASSYSADITPAADGTVTVDVAAGVCTDTAGNSNTAATQFSIVSDTTAPAGASIIINNSWDTYTNSTSVTLTMGATGAGEMMISEDSAFGGASYEAYAASKAFTLSSGDGEKTVYVKYKDAAGNETSAVNDTIILDTTPPTVTITSTAASPTNAALIPFTVTFSEHVISFGYQYYNGTLDHYTSSGNTYVYYVAPTADGTVKFVVHVYAAIDDAGNSDTNAEDVELSIVSDRTAPTGTSVSINRGDTYTNSASVTLALGATDASEMMISEQSSFDGASYETYTTIRSFTLSSGDGIKTIYVKYKDAIGNESSAVSDTIVLDTAAPTGTGISINSGDTYTNSPSVTLTLDATGASEMMISENSDFSGASYETYAASKAFTLSSGDGEKTVYVKYRDAVGNVADVVSDSIELDTTAPTVEITTSVSDPTNAAIIPVTITFSEDVTGFDVSDISVGNGSAGSFSGSGTTYTADISPSADGMVTVDVAAGVCADAAGNNNAAAMQLSIVSDTTAPTVSITSVQSDPAYQPFEIVITFNENVTELSVADIVVGNGAASSFAASSASEYRAQITPAAYGTVTVDIAADVCIDDAGNGNAAASRFAIEYVNTIPNRKPAVPGTHSASVEVNTAYTLDLSGIFEDANGDSLTYEVKVNSSGYVAAAARYSYTPAAAGVYTLVFRANDGTDDSADTYTVTLTATAVPTTTPKPTTTPAATPTPRPTAKPTATPTATPTQTPTATATPGDANDTGGDAQETQAIIPETIDENDDGTVTVTINTDILPQGTQSVQLPDGTAVRLTGGETLTLTVSADMIDAGKVQLVALNNEGVPLGNFEVQTDNGVLIDVSGIDTVSSGFMKTLWWILGIAAGLGIIALVAYFVLIKRRGA